MALIVVCVARYIAIFTAVCGIALGQSAADHNARRETLNRYCFGCHNSNLKSGGLAIDSLDPAHVDRQSDTWERVVRRLTARSMPPTGLPRPDESGYRTLLSAIETDLDRAAAANLNPGRTDTFRRLTRAEYRNAVRDLLAIDTDVTALLPSDESSHGFDNVTVGNLSPALLERYLAAAEKLSRLALGHAGRAPPRRSMHRAYV